MRVLCRDFDDDCLSVHEVYEFYGYEDDLEGFICCFTDYEGDRYISTEISKFQYDRYCHILAFQGYIELEKYRFRFEGDE